ncbi:MAG: ABC transporter substrate-binding protein, partial [Desulfitobacterium hafniense]
MKRKSMGLLLVLLLAAALVLTGCSAGGNATPANTTPPDNTPQTGENRDLIPAVVGYWGGT